MAFVIASLATFTGSMIPISIMSPCSPVLALIPALQSKSAGTALPPTGIPALIKISRQGASNALLKIAQAIFRDFESLLSYNLSIISEQDRYAVPPPGSIPSSRAERTAHTASSIRSYSSFCSRSVLPPTYITPIPPVREAIRCLINSLSAFVFVILCCSQSWSTRYFTLSSFWSSASLTITVSSFDTIIFFALPRSSKVIRLRSSPVLSEK